MNRENFFESAKVVFVTGEDEGKKNGFIASLALNSKEATKRVFVNPENNLSPNRQYQWWKERDTEDGFFLIATNSPIIILGCPLECRIFRVEGDKVVEVEVDPRTLTPTSLLTSPVFDFQEIFSVRLNDVSDLDPEDRWSDIFDRRRLEDRIAQASKEPSVIPPGWLDDENEE